MGRSTIEAVTVVVLAIACEATDERGSFGVGGPGLGSASESTSADGQDDPGDDDDDDGGSSSAGGTSLDSGDADEGGSDGEETGSAPGFCDDDEVWGIAFENQAVPTAADTYVCRGFTLATDSLRHAIAFAPTIDNATHVHHIVLYRVSSPVGATQQECARGQDWVIQYGWAPGADPFVLPPEAGFLVGEGAGGQTHFVLEIHYNNPLETPGQIDGSGVEVCLTPNLRPHSAGMLALGKVSGIEIPPGEPAWIESGTCPSEVTAAAMGGGSITVFGSMLHAHLLGRAIRTEQYRDGQLVGELGRDDSYDFNDQKIVPIEGEVHAGDELVTTCVYDSTSRTTTTQGGEGTSDEMCLNGLAYYPVLPLPRCF